jgi:hypothetical protein
MTFDMRNRNILLLPFFLILFSGCKTSEDRSQGISVADSLAQITERISLDFSLNEDEVNEQIENRIGSFTAADKMSWEEKGWLEYRLIDGRKKFFRRTVSNLILMRKFYEEHDLWLKETAEDPDMVFRLKHTSEAFSLSMKDSSPVVPVNFAIKYTITVHPDAVPDGETIRCWMPLPKSNHPRQRKVKLLNTSNPEYSISPDSAIHSSLYMQEKAKKGVPTIFSISYSYESCGKYYNLEEAKILPYNKESYEYRKYTTEQLPQINFSGEVRQLADSLTGKEDNPQEIVRKIYMWFKECIPWAGALEYSIMPDIPAYVLRNRRGDCGMQTFLFMSMLRYKGIPVRWQSGWMIPPGAENLHDWCEVFFEGVGWVPADVSYDLQNSGIKGIREYYLSGIDSYRMIVNDGVAGNLYPQKQYLRSEPYDFQRGEIEWKGGNLYFDKWDYDIKIEYLK